MTHAWEQLWKWWIVMFATAGVAVAVVIGFAGSVHPAGRALGFALLAVLGLGYWRLGFPAMKARDDRRSAIYVLMAILCEAALLAITPAAFLLLFGLFPQCYAAFARFRWMVLSATALTLVSALGSLRWEDWQLSALPQVLIQSGFSAAFGLFFAGWITKIIMQSTERANLIDELERTRGELAVAQRTAGARGERERMSAEIHDTLAQGFTSIVLLAQAARSDPNRRDQHLASIESTARDNLAEARALVADLGPAALRSASLPEAIARVANALAGETGIEVRFRTSGPPRALPPEQDVVLLRAAQESLTNIRKHAIAHRVDVELDYTNEVRLSVRDDGVGFDPSVATDGSGLDGLRRRVAAVGGEASISSAPEHGSMIVVEIP